jgi:hypothetical protein
MPMSVGRPILTDLTPCHQRSCGGPWTPGGPPAGGALCLTLHSWNFSNPRFSTCQSPGIPVPRSSLDPTIGFDPSHIGDSEYGAPVRDAEVADGSGKPELLRDLKSKLQQVIAERQ